MRSHYCVVRLGLLVLLIVVLFSLPVFAQGDYASVSGRVTDPGGLSIAGAKVNAVNTGTNVTASLDTNESGLYNFPNLLPGTYQITVEKDGFNRVVQPNVVLHVTDAIAINFTLQVGSVTQSVTVEGAAPLVNTENSSLGGLVNEQKMADLPLNGRNFVDLTLMQPGVTNDANYGGVQAQGGTTGVYFSSNGAPIRANNVTMDGSPMMNLNGNTGNAVGTSLGVEGILEYKVISTAASAEYGLGMGSQIVIASRGGTNQFHGDAFDYFRNNDLDARNFFDYTHLTTGKRLPQLQKNNFGGAFGGPIRKDKTFFYAVYEGLRQHQGQTILDTVPAAGCHAIAATGAGGAYEFAAGGGKTAAQNAAACGSTFVAPGGTGTVTEIPAVVVPLLSMYPSPNVGTSQFTYPIANPERVDFGQIRMDQTISASDSMFGRFTIDDAQLTGAQSLPQFSAITLGREIFATLSETHIISQSLLNTGRITYSREATATALGFPGSNQGAYTSPQLSFVAGNPFGGLVIGGLTTIGSNTLGSGGGNNQLNVYSLSDDIGWTKGKHAFKFGTLMNRFERYIYSQGTYVNGLLTFAGLPTFLQGIPSNYRTLAPGSLTKDEYYYYTYGFYGQDDWHATSRLTLNLGLRYEFNTTVKDKANLSYAFLNILAPFPVGSPTGGTTQGPPFDNPSLHNFSPRIGYAWDVFGNGKTAVRSAFGIYYDEGDYNFVLGQPASGTPPKVSYINNPPGVQPVITMPLSFALNSPAALNTTFYNIDQPYMMQWNLTVEERLPWSSALSLSYVGNKGNHLWMSEEGNPCQPTSITNGIPFWSKDCGLGRVNPQLSTCLCHGTNGGSTYEGLQALYTKRLTHGLEAQVAYTYSKNLDTSQGQGGGMECTSSGANIGAYPTNIKWYDKGPSCFDLANNLRANFLYHLPNVKSDSAFMRGITNGWWAGSLISWQTGYPFTVNDGAYRSFSDHLQGTSNSTDRASFGTATVAPGQTGPDGSVNNTGLTFIPYNPATVITGNPQQWYNPLMFTPGVIGYLGVQSRDALRGPHLGDLDLSINKDTRIPLLGEQGMVEFRAEFFNILNHANWNMPSGTAYPGSTTDVGDYSEKPTGSAGQITSTVTTARQIQLALKLIF